MHRLPQQAQLSPKRHTSAKAERKSCYGLSRRASLVVAPRPSLLAAADVKDRCCLCLLLLLGFALHKHVWQ